MNGTTPPSGTPTLQQPTAEPAFAMRFTSSPRGARLARRLVSHRLNEWGHAYTSPTNETVTLITAELASNAVRHGHVPGRDFHVRLTASPAAIRVEVTDTRGERLPLLPARPPGDAQCGRGLFIVAHLATRWAIAPCPDAPGKTVWAELDLMPQDGEATADPLDADPVRPGGDESRPHVSPATNGNTPH